MGERLKSVLTGSSLDRASIVDQPGYFAGHGGDRLTRVPFLKICLQGHFNRLVVDQDREQKCHRVAVNAGEAVFFIPQSFVSVEFTGPCQFLRITFEADGVLIGMETFQVVRMKGKDWPSGDLEATWIEGMLGQPAAGLLEGLMVKKSHPVQALTQLKALLWEIAELLIGPTYFHRDATTEPRQSVLTYLRDQCHRPLSRKSAASALGISPGYLGRLVKETTGLSFQKHMTQLRLETARWLLRHGNLPVQEIALRSGFTSANYFAQVFKRSTEQTPAQWRNSRARCRRG